MISIIIPIFNAGDRLKVMLDSVLLQSYSDYEVILVDDGSLDQSGTICDSYASKDDRFKVIHQTQKGVSSARNQGLKESSGKYITFLDADDEIPKNYLSVLLETLLRTQSDIAVCDVTLYEKGKEMSRFTLASDNLSKIEAMNYLLTRKHINSGPCAKLFCRKIVEGLLFPELGAYEDIIFVRDAFDLATTISATNKTEYRYIRNKKGIMNQFNQMPSNDIVIASENLLDYIEKHNELSPECMYVTLSHLYQSVQKNGHIEKKDRLLNNSIKIVFKKHWKSMVRCKAFSWKEKVLFTLFSIGIDV